MKLAERWRQTCNDWALQSYYQRFESAVALMLTLLISLIIVVALYRPGVTVLTGLLYGALDPLDYEVFQTVFGGHLLALAAVTLVLGVTYWLLRERDDRQAVSKRTSP